MEGIILYIKKQCIVFCVLLAISCILFGCGSSDVQAPTAATEVTTQPTVPETESEELLATTEAIIMLEPTEAIIDATEDMSVTMGVTTPEESKPDPWKKPYETPSDFYPVVGVLKNPQPTDIVDVRLYIPEIFVELKYAGTDNFTGQQIYGFEDAYLRFATVMKLKNVCDTLREQGYYLKIWDAFRPGSAQHTLWAVYPDPDYVANPKHGFSAHTRGNTVDVTLVDEQGNELEMPSAFDDFSDAANRDYSDCSEEAKKNAEILRKAMEDNGFKGYWAEWWHFSDRIQYDAETVFDPNRISVWYPKCEEYISLREKASGYSEVIAKIYVRTPFVVLGYDGQFAMAEAEGLRGYVLRSYIQELP